MTVPSTESSPAPAVQTIAQAGSAVAPIAAPRFAIVGCGTVGGVHRDRLLAENIEIVGVCDPDADALARMAESLPRRPRLFRSEQDLLAAGVADAVVLCTPHGRHAEQIERALDAGVHVLCEKPFVTRAEQASALVQKARQQNLALFVSYTRRSRGHARFLLESAARIGPLSNVVITRAQPWVQMHRRTWRMHENEGGGFLLDAGASMLDLLLRLTHSTVAEIDAELLRFGAMDVDVRASLRITLVNGTRAEMTLVGDATEHVERIQLFGEKGTAGWLLRQDAAHELYVRVAEDEVPGAGTSENAVAANYRTLSPDQSFVAALRGNVVAEPDLYDAATVIPTVALVERIYHEAVWR